MRRYGRMVMICLLRSRVARLGAIRSAKKGAFNKCLLDRQKSAPAEQKMAPYKGGAPALTDVVGGHIALLFADPAPALPLIESEG